MELEDQVRLSFYKEIASVDERHGVVLVQHTGSNKIYVQKKLKRYDLSIFETLKGERYVGVPVIKELIESNNELIAIEDYISGHSLEEMMEVSTFKEADAIDIISKLCDILRPIHSHKPSIIHRDIKASNVIIDNEGKVYLIDFDASKVVTNGKNRDTDLIGTEEYAAPEQYGFGQSDQRTDIYALGILTNKLLTGKFPSEELYNGELSLIITKATALDPANRYQNVDALREALANISSYGVTIEFENNSGNVSEGLTKLLSRLPYPIRELPGFRSGRLLPFCAALLWYAFLISFGFFATATNPEYTPAQNRFYDLATFAVLFIPTLYLGNYLGVRDKFPWRKSSNKTTELLRIAAGLIAIVFFVIIVVTILSIILNI